MIYITCDHAGFDLKQKIVKYFDKNNLKYIDLGPFKYIELDDYPDYAKNLCEKILNDSNSLGIIICKNGVGVSIACNRFKGIRTALTFSKEHAKSSKIDDNSNIIALPSAYLSYQKSIEIINEWLKTNFLNEPKYLRRINKLDQI